MARLILTAFGDQDESKKWWDTVSARLRRMTKTLITGMVYTVLMSFATLPVVFASSGNASVVLHPDDPHMRGINVDAGSLISVNYEASLTEIEFFFIFGDDYESFGLINPIYHYHSTSARVAVFSFSPNRAGEWYMVFISSVEQDLAYSFEEDRPVDVIYSGIYVTLIIALGGVSVYSGILIARKVKSREIE